SKGGSYQQTCEDQPRLLVLDRKRAAGLTRLQARPEVAEEDPIPIALGAAENLLQALKEPRRSQLLALAERLRERNADPSPGAGERVRRDIGFRLGRRCGLYSGRGKIALVRAQVEFERPGLRDIR